MASRRSSASDLDILIENLSDDEIEVLLLSELLEEAEPAPSFLTKGRFDMKSITPLEARNLFRFEREDIPRLRAALKLPARLYIANGTAIDGDDALAIALRRLAYPNRLCDLEMLFGRHMSTLSAVSNKVTDHILSTFGHLLKDFKCHDWLDVEEFASVSCHPSDQFVFHK